MKIITPNSIYTTRLNLGSRISTGKKIIGIWFSVSDCAYYTIRDDYKSPWVYTASEHDLHCTGKSKDGVALYAVHTNLDRDTRLYIGLMYNRKTYVRLHDGDDWVDLPRNEYFLPS